MLLYAFVCVVVLALFLRWRTRRVFRRNAVGFLHATSGNGGGGERVLWVAIDQLQRADAVSGVEREYVLYTNAYHHPVKGNEGTGRTDGGGDTHGRGRAEAALLGLVYSQFRIRPIRSIKFVFLREGATQWLRAEKYPRLTLLLQTVVGGVLLFWEAAVVNSATPLMMETVGVPMVYPLLRVLAGCSVVSYTHFPVVSSSMMERVRAGTVSTTNKGAVVTHPVLRLAKLVYYQAFALLYRFLGQFPELVFTNSSWTQGHLRALFWPRQTRVLYPPCDVKVFAARSKPPEARRNTVVSVGQFRPEKNHMLQLRAFHRATREGLPADARLIMLGGTRNESDEARATALVEEADRLGISSRVDVVVNASFDDVVSYLTDGCVGLHTMLDEHFGIVVLEYLAAGVVPLAHDSGGVKLDIVASPDIGFLADDELEFARAMVHICRMRQSHPDLYKRFQECGALHVQRFSDSAFGEQLRRHMESLLAK